MIKTRNTSLFLSSLVACAGAPAALVHSPLTQAANVLEEVIVTSRKRAESLQDVPIAVTAITEDTIAELRIDNIEDVAALAPNLVVNTSAGGSPSAVACMRGMCRTNTIITEDPMVGTYVNGVYLGKAVGSLVDILDLERIEILRGPQGTLFGKNTLGGPINMVTVKPGPEFEGSVNATYGGECSLAAPQHRRSSLQTPPPPQRRTPQLQHHLTPPQQQSPLRMCLGNAR